MTNKVHIHGFWRAFAWVMTGPAIYVNIEATPPSWMPFAIGSVMLASVCVYLAWEKGSFWFWTLGAIFTAINLTTALSNVSGISAEAISGRGGVIEQKGSVSGQIAKLTAAREAQEKIAWELATETIEGNMQALIASDSTRWKASDHCNPDKVTQPETRSLCDAIAKEKAKKAAAEKRDEIDTKLAELRKKEVFGGPDAKDPYAESLARFLSVFGFTFSDEGKSLLSASKDWGKAIGLELMAAFGPMALVALFELLFASSPAAASGPARTLVSAAPAQAETAIDLYPMTQAAISAVEKAEQKRAVKARKRLPAPKALPSRPDVEPRLVFNMVRDLIGPDGRLYYSDAETRIKERFGKITPQMIGRMLATIGTRGGRETREGKKREHVYRVTFAA